MTYFRYVSIVALVLLVTACGRRLDDSYFRTNTDFVQETTATEVAPADDSAETDAQADEASDTETTDASEETTTDDTSESDEEAEVETMLVEVPVDPIVEQVANADPEHGQTLIGENIPCTSCHYLDSEDMLVGPGFANLPARAENRVGDQVAERYLYNSILHPNEYVVEGYPQGVMPVVYADYPEQDILDIVAYLMTLGPYPEREPQFMEVPVESSPESDEEVAEATEEVASAEDTSAEEETEAQATEVAETPEETATEDVADTSEETQDAAETESEDVAGEDATEQPAQAQETTSLEPRDIDLSGVPSTIDVLADYGVVSIGEELFNEALVSGTSCATCHTVDGNPLASQTDVSHVGSFDNAASYIWASIYNSEMHPGFAMQYEQVLSGADTANLVAYLLSLATDE